MCPLCRHWADETASQHLFAGKDLLETNLFELSMEANSEAVARLLAMGRSWDTVIVYPAFGNEVRIILKQPNRILRENIKFFFNLR